MYSYNKCNVKYLICIVLINILYLINQNRFCGMHRNYGKNLEEGKCNKKLNKLHRNKKNVHNNIL